MQYEIEFPEVLWDQIHALSEEAGEPLAEAMILLGHDPWHRTPYHPDNPTTTSGNSCTASAQG